MMKIHDSWQPILKETFETDSFQNLKAFLISEIEKKKTIYPHPSEIFAAFDACLWNSVKVVILGQDPYHTPLAAHGMAFSVQKGIKIPPSLQNMYKELESDMDINTPEHGYLMGWAEQGVLLLNSVLTVEQAKPASHAKQGWEEFTDTAIKQISEQKENIVFILWGKYAQKKGSHIDRTKHLVLEAPHPSPFSAHSGFFGSKPYSQTNTYLQDKGFSPIDWSKL